MSDKILCMVCGAELDSISPAHLKKHNMTLAEYKSLYPDSPIKSDSLLQKMADKNRASNAKRKGIPRDEDVKQKMRDAKKANPTVAWNKGIQKTDEQKRRQSELVKQKYRDGLKHWNQGNVTPQSVKDKISQTALKQNRTYSEQSKIKRNETLQRKRESGWVHHSTYKKGTKITDPVTLQKIRDASKRTNLRRVKDSIDRIMHICERENLAVRFIEDNYWIHMTCQTCATEFVYTRQLFKPCTKHGSNLCPTCYPRKNGRSIKEQQLADFIKSVYDGKVIQNDRVKLNGKELDVYLPDVDIAFEFNGLYWHSETNYSGNKHHLLHKQQYAFKNGVRVIHIYEDEWDNKREIVESRILHTLGLQKQTIYARHCTIKQISSKVKDEFLALNHIMGCDVSGIRYGAFRGEELVAVMTFAPTNFIKGGKGDIFELNRFSIKRMIHIPGIASKMFKRFISDHTPTTVISYCDRRWNIGESYNAMGFKLVETTPPSYWYMLQYKHRLHRSNFMKHKIVTLDNQHMTEWEIMQQMGYDRIWDCGNLKYEWTHG